MRPDRKKTNVIVIHCSATKVEADIGAKEIREMHLDRGWQDIGYHFVIRRNGTVETGENLNSLGAHVKGYNSISVGVCLVGGLSPTGASINNYSMQQRASLIKILKFLKELYPEAEIVGHRDLSPDLDGDGEISAWEFMKDCPCFDVKEFLHEFAPQLL